jgi:hypothetical protein
MKPKATTLIHNQYISFMVSNEQLKHFGKKKLGVAPPGENLK